MEKKKILLIGSSNMDLSMNVFKLPAVGETVIDDGGVAYTPGGKGANAAVALSRLGADAIFCTKLGADAHGQRLYNFYKDEGINTSYIKVDRDNPTGLAVVIKEGDGANRIIVYPGANSALTQENLLEAFSSEPDALYLGFEIPFALAVSAARIASQRGIPIFVDAGPASREFELDKLPELEVFSPNETETYEYTGIMPMNMETSLRAAINLHKKVKCKYLVIKQGSRGAFFYDGKRYNTFPAIRVDKVVDTTAAGDTFTAALTLEYMRNGKDIRGAIQYASCASAISVTRKGASSSTPTAEEVLAVVRTLVK